MKKLLIVFITIFLANFAVPRLAQATSYFISPTGNDNNSGTTTQDPWLTLSRANAVALQGGDAIYLEAAQTFNGMLYFDANDQANGTPIVVSSYGNGRATINGGTYIGLQAYNTAGLDISNLNFVGSGLPANTQAGINFLIDLPNDTKLNYVHIDNVSITGFKDGIGFWSNQGRSGYRDIRITNVTVTNGGNSGIYTHSPASYGFENVYIGHTQVSNIVGTSTKANGGSGNGIVLGMVDGATVERSVVHDNGMTGGANVGIWTYNSRNVTIQYNESYNNKTATAVDGGGFDLDGGVVDSVMQYNYSHDNDGAGFGLFQYAGAPTYNNNTLRYNISQNDARKNNYGGITLWGANSTSLVQNSKIYGNTVFASKPVGTSRAFMVSGSYVANISVYNNIFITTNGQQLISSPAISTMNFYGNNYWSSGAGFSIGWGKTNANSLANWRTASGKELLNGTPTGWQVDPQVTSGGGGTTIGNADLLTTLTAYKLLATSPLINQGLDLQTLFGVNPGPHDFYEIVLPQGPALDVGANEYQ